MNEWVMSELIMNDLLSTSLSNLEHQWNWCEYNVWNIVNENEQYFIDCTILLIFMITSSLGRCYLDKSIYLTRG